MSVISEVWNFIWNMPEELIEPISFIPDFLKDALIDSLNLLPFLFLIFLIIEFVEHYYAKKRHLFVFWIKKIGPLFGSVFASLPQCGFSVIASTIYTRRLLSRGTLVAVYLATSDEAIPVLLAYPQKAPMILPIIGVKVAVAIIAGYVVDWLVTYNAKEPVVESVKEEDIEGCCHHHIIHAARRRDFWLHPLKHTLNIFVFIFLISVVLAFILSRTGSEDVMAKYCLMNSPLQPFLVSLVGLIPNCAISVMLTMLFVKNTISFGSLVAGLCTSGGLGILVLLRKNGDKKDTFIILGLLVLIGTILGLIFQYNVLNINGIFELIGIKI